jgi:hypothetical protein
MFETLRRFLTGRQKPVFDGVEHTGLYPTHQSDAYAVAKWYAEKFGFQQVDGKSSLLLRTDSFGFLEIMKGEPQEYCHVAIHTPNFEAALQDLDTRGIAYHPPVIKAGVKIAYLKEADPCGNRVHLVWRNP